MPVYRYKGLVVDSVRLNNQDVYFYPGSNVNIPDNMTSLPYISRLVSRMLLVPVVGGSNPDPIEPETPSPAPAPAPV